MLVFARLIIKLFFFFEKQILTLLECNEQLFFIHNFLYKKYLFPTYFSIDIVFSDLIEPEEFVNFSFVNTYFLIKVFNF